MADFTTDLHILKQPYPFLDMDPNMEFTNNILESSTSVFQHTPTLNFHTPMSLFNESQFSHQSQDFPGNLAEIFSGNFLPKEHYLTCEAVSQPITKPEDELKRKAISVSESSSGICSSLAISDSRSKRKNNSGKGKRRKINEKEEEKQKEVVHVRARRGQATDSHSLAERVRRSRINERLRCLQDIVPGCYKTMGLAMMLDEIINYVQSLQSQVEFLSMKLTAASSYYDFNSESDDIDRLQRAKADEVKELERLMKEGHGVQANFHTTWQT